MTMRYLPEARDDLDEAVEFYEAQKSGLGTRFQAAVSSAIDRITQFPEAFSMFDDRLRRCPLKKFPYRIIDSSLTGEIVVIAIAHQSRQPGHWKGRA